MLDFSSVSWLGIAVATVVVYAVGAIWYSPVLFSKRWQKEVGLTKETMKNPVVPMLVGLLNAVAIVWLLEVFLVSLNAQSFYDFMWISKLIGLVFVAFTILSNYLYANKSLTLFLIDGGYRYLQFPVAAIVLYYF